MPMIKSSSDLHNHYNEISELCHQSHQPVFITKNGRGDLAVLDMEGYERLAAESALREELMAALQAILDGDVQDLSKARAEISAYMNRREHKAA
ncbi:MAG: type II toxin-antitoxin system Phd/YefM family antitoxin [Coriobacteriales bacterium]|nr:type II toxin-antitoxin system Phd/YefM family antitoxin [Coriobacteriales bacterium]